MGISFEKERKIFHLYTEKYSYYIHVNKLNYLIHLYDGDFLDDISKERVSERYMERYAYLSNDKEICDEDYYFSSIASLMECASFGKGDKRGAFAIVEGEDGIDITNFLYVSHKIQKIEEYPLNFPHIRFKNGDADELIITLKDEVRDIFLNLHYIVSEKFNCLVRYSHIINKGKEKIIIKKLSSMELDLNSDDYEIIALHGTRSNDTQEEIIPLNHSLTVIGDNHGARGFYYNPSICLKEKEATLSNGKVYGFSYIYSGDFAYEIKVDEISNSRILCGFCGENFQKTLFSDEEFVTPQCLIVYSNEGINGMSHIMHDIIRERVIPEKFAFSERPILLNSWEACTFDFNTDKIISFIDEAKKLGIELVVIDDGWFGKRNSDNCSLGDWYENKEKIDLKKIVDYSHSIGMKIGLWVEPEMISPDSDLYRDHKDYVLGAKEYTLTLFRHQLVLDLVNPNTRKNVLNQLFAIFDNLHFDYVKRDFNRFISEGYSECLPKERKKETYYDFICGVYELLDCFTKRYPSILLETCASGGGRFDLGMLFYSPQIWASDETDITLRSKIQFSKNMFYPLSTIGAHVSNRKIGSIQDKACLAFFGTFGYELDITKCSEEDKKQITFFNGLYKEWHHIVTTGDYFALYDPFKSNYVAFNVVTKDKKECAVYFMNLAKEATKSRFVKIKGLNSDKYYFNSFTNDIYKGSFYLNIGLNLSAPLEAFTGMMFILKEVDPIRATLYRKTKQKDGGKREKLI